MEQKQTQKENTQKIDCVSEMHDKIYSRTSVDQVDFMEIKNESPDKIKDFLLNPDAKNIFYEFLVGHIANNEQDHITEVKKIFSIAVKYLNGDEITTLLTKKDNPNINAFYYEKCKYFHTITELHNLYNKNIINSFEFEKIILHQSHKDNNIFFQIEKKDDLWQAVAAIMRYDQHNEVTRESHQIICSLLRQKNNKGDNVIKYRISNSDKFQINLTYNDTIELLKQFLTYPEIKDMIFAKNFCGENIIFSALHGINELFVSSLKESLKKMYQNYMRDNQDNIIFDKNNSEEKNNNEGVKNMFFETNNEGVNIFHKFYTQIKTEKNVVENLKYISVFDNFYFSLEEIIGYEDCKKIMQFAMDSILKKESLVGFTKPILFKKNNSIDVDPKFFSLLKCFYENIDDEEDLILYTIHDELQNNNNISILSTFIEQGVSKEWLKKIFFDTNIIVIFTNQERDNIIIKAMRAEEDFQSFNNIIKNIQSICNNTELRNVLMYKNKENKNILSFLTKEKNTIEIRGTLFDIMGDLNLKKMAYPQLVDSKSELVSLERKFKKKYAHCDYIRQYEKIIFQSSYRYYRNIFEDLDIELKGV